MSFSPKRYSSYVDVLTYLRRLYFQSFIVKSCFCILVLLLNACFSTNSSPYRVEADSLKEQDRFDEAVTAYWKHIHYRLAIKDRPTWENPYIYLLDIGDIYLKQGQVDRALEHYKLADKYDVDRGYVNDRYLSIARWYEEHGELHKALAHLQIYSERDPIIFDLMMDRIAKQILTDESSSISANNN